ncbi:uncharacterized protein VP01_6115g1 [Puccinia sorghi]|uniref:Uncharacterized protein n=1 Tax=Puccinia sorghi TaxID=27349 RepID=A0A0L6UGX2_9BASI|nr:uncharacterized protein VP01_6115g1 [Puccinia sorghi]
MLKKATPKPTKPNTKKPAIQRKSKKNRGNNSSEDDAADKTEGHLKKDNKMVIIEWLKIKHDGYQFLKSTPSKINLTPPQMKDQFNTYKVKYKKFHTKSIYMGFVLTNEDQKVGISTFNENLESMCPHYHLMNDLMGD